MDTKKDYNIALKEASNLATHMWKKFYSEESPHFELCDSLAGIMTQIDNMVTGLERKSELYYTKEKPTVDGDYWIKRPDIELTELAAVVVVDGSVRIDFGEAIFNVDFNRTEEDVEDDWSVIGGKNITWYGPVFPPK